MEDCKLDEILRTTVSIEGGHQPLPIAIPFHPRRKSTATPTNVRMVTTRSTMPNMSSANMESAPNPGAARKARYLEARVRIGFGVLLMAFVFLFALLPPVDCHSLDDFQATRI